MRASRWPALILGAVAISAAFFVGALDDIDDSPSGAELQASARPGSWLEGSGRVWLCPTLRTERLGIDTGAQLVIVNPLDVPATARVTFEGRSTASSSVTMSLPPQSRTLLDDSGLAEESQRAALVEVSESAVVVSRLFENDQGQDAAACTTQIGEQVIVPTGSTRVDAAEVLVFYNPFSDDAVLDIVAATEAEFGFFEASELTGIVVPAGSIRSISLADSVRRRDAIALLVQMRKGRVAVDRFVRYDGTADSRGFSAEIASPSAGLEWYGPVGPLIEIEKLVIFNPGEEAAEVDIEFQSVGEFVPPVQRTVPPNDLVILDVAVEVPVLELGAVHGVVVRSLNDVAIQVDLVGGQDLDAAALENRLATIDISALADRTASRWVVPSFFSHPELGALLLVQNPGDEDVLVSVESIGNGSRSGVTEVLIPARAVLTMGLEGLEEGTHALIVSADAPIVVASSMSRSRPSGLGWSVAVSLSDSQ